MLNLVQYFFPSNYAVSKSVRKMATICYKRNQPSLLYFFETFSTSGGDKILYCVWTLSVLYDHYLSCDRRNQIAVYKNVKKLQ